MPPPLCSNGSMTEPTILSAPLGTARPSLFDTTPQQLGDWLVEHGQPRYRADQVLQWAYRGASSYQAMSNLPAALRALLNDAFSLRALTTSQDERSPDGWTRKVTFKLHDGGVIESVHMRHPASGGRMRTTLCISSQAGCAYGCKFCATGQMGYGRNLTTGEIVEQVVHFLGSSQERAEETRERQLTNVVFMGMGEPFANYAAVQGAIGALNATWGVGLGARHITVSTVGLVPEIGRFAIESPQVGLAISLHAPTDDLRSEIMPVNQKYPLAELITACKGYLAQTKRRVTFEYVLLAGVNDSLLQARQLAQLLKGLLCHVNLIPVNPTSEGAFKRPSTERIRAFSQELQRLHIPATLRDTQGMEIQAACGQLRAREQAGALR